MKTILRALPIFILLMMLIYWVPQIASNSPSEIITQKTKLQEVKKESNSNQSTLLKQDTLPEAGMGEYMGKAIETIQEKYGEPLRIDQTAYGYDWWVYGEDEQDYFQIGVSHEGKITNVFVLGSQLDVSPFQIGMDVTEIYQIAMFYPTFSIDYQEETYMLELSENDLNFHPLIAFENQTFAILMVDRKTNEVNAVRYLDKRSLLQLGVYEIASQTPVPPVKHQDEELNDIYASNHREILEILNNLRQRYEIPELVYSEELSSIADSVFSYQEKLYAADLLEKDNAEVQKQLDEEKSSSEGTLDDDSEIEAFIEEDATTEETQLGDYPPLTSEQIQMKLEMEQVKVADTRVLYFDQSADSTWLTTFWFSLENQRRLLTDPEMKRFGISFRSQEVLLMLDKEAENSE